MEIFVGVLSIVVVILVVFNLFRNRTRRMREAEAASKTAAGSGLSISRGLFEPSIDHHAPVESFHVAGAEARVTFDVPLDGDDDSVLFDLLTNEAVEVVRQKRHTLPIDDVTEIVVFAGRNPVREVGRTKLLSPGELPPPAPELGITFAHIAHDPFAAPFDDETDHSVTYDTRIDVPEDELGPLRGELRIPKGLDRGLRALGTDPDELNGPDFVLALLRMFGYGVTEQAYEGTYLALKEGVSTYIATDTYEPGQHPELEEAVIRRFVVNFSSSGADRGMLITDKYSPFMIHEIEANQPKIRFVTRERIQRFIDSMALG